MKERSIKDIVIPLDRFPTVNASDNLSTAMKKFKEAQKNAPKGRPFIGMIVVNKKGKVIGKIGHKAILCALNPRHDKIFDLDQLQKSSISNNFLESISDSFDNWVSDSVDLKALAESKLCSDIMHPIAEHIDEEHTLAHALHHLITWDSLTVPVSRGDKIIGVVRLMDIYFELEKIILSKE